MKLSKSLLVLGILFLYFSLVQTKPILAYMGFALLGMYWEYSPNVSNS